MVRPANKNKPAQSKTASYPECSDASRVNPLPPQSCRLGADHRRARHSLRKANLLGVINQECYRDHVTSADMADWFVELERKERKVDCGRGTKQDMEGKIGTKMDCSCMRTVSGTIRASNLLPKCPLFSRSAASTAYRPFSRASRCESSVAFSKLQQSGVYAGHNSANLGATSRT